MGDGPCSSSLARISRSGRLLAQGNVFAQEAQGGRSHNIVENHGAIDKQGETEDLKPLERLPPKTQTDDPDEQSPTSVDGAPRGGGDCAGDGEAEEIETARGGMVRWE